MINEYSWQENLDRYTLYPVQLQHIGERCDVCQVLARLTSLLGLKSVRGSTEVDAQAVWSMAFEEKRADTLAKQHAELATKLYGG